MRECLLQKERNLDEKVEIVERILYIHVPFGSILVIDDRTFHGGHYGSKQVRRFHFVVSPRKWRNDEQGDRLLFLLEAARQHTKKWREHTGNWKDGGWAEKDDPKVAQPKLPIGELNKMIGQIKYSTRTKYYESFVEHCYPENTLDNLKMVSKLIPDYIHTKCFNDSTK
jgi:frataxin-like iron-binding protein CyaY